MSVNARGPGRGNTVRLSSTGMKSAGIACTGSGEHKMILYHFTTPENAAKIREEKRFRTREVYASNRPDGRCLGYYGDAMVTLDIPDTLAVPDDSFRTGEKFYRIPANGIRPEYIKGDEWIEASTS